MLGMSLLSFLFSLSSEQFLRLPTTTLFVTGF
jgi:hypothetical protein